MHRTKYTNIAKMCYVHILKELTDDIGKNMLSLLLDKGNDISIIRLLGVSASYEFNKGESTYQGLAQLEKCDASSIVPALLQHCYSIVTALKNG